MHTHTIAFIGGGNLASAIITGLVTHGHDPKRIIASRRRVEKLSLLQQQYGINTTTDNLLAASEANILVLAVKPQQLNSVCQQLQTTVQKKKPLIVSVVTGKTIATIAKYLGTTALPIVRCVTNTAAQIGCSATAAFANTFVNTQKQQINQILNTIGKTVWLAREVELDIVTALSGSGPAYHFYIIEAFIRAAIKQGLDAKAAKILAEQTALGAAKMAQLHDSLTTLYQQIIVPGGTTEQGIEVLQEQQVAEILAEVITKAKQRATELAQI